MGTTAELRAVHVGVDRVSPTVFGRLAADLRGAASDAATMRGVSDARAFASRILTDEHATVASVTAALRTAAARTRPGDLLLLTFAGHGVRLRAAGSDPDGWDEAWCLYDGVLLDDVLHDILADLPADSDAVVVTDACFSGGVVDGGTLRVGAARRVFDVVVPPAAAGPATAAPLFETLSVRALPLRGSTIRAVLARQGSLRGVPSMRLPTRAIAARVVALAASGENAPAYESSASGLFTSALVSVLESKDGAEASYTRLMQLASARMRLQVPTIGIFGAAGSSALDAPALAPAPRALTR